MRKKLYRNKENAFILGVCAGIADYFDIDVTIVRLLFAIGTIFFTAIIFGVLLYIACAFIIPVAPDYIEGDYKEKEF